MGVKLSRLDGTQVTKDANTQLIYLDVFHELNKELLKVLSERMA